MWHFFRRSKPPFQLCEISFFHIYLLLCYVATKRWELLEAGVDGGGDWGCHGTHLPVGLLFTSRLPLPLLLLLAGPMLRRLLLPPGPRLTVPAPRVAISFDTLAN